MKVSVFDDNGQEIWSHARDENGNRSGMTSNIHLQNGTQEKITDLLQLAHMQAAGEKSRMNNLD